ncbi:hypothetical protein GCK32_017506 [Trichostrongylus colubriformis]|uniref:VWFA domain-containing protein n=1 Tax=Trichostrongylus colubriformis TaxID=6319 RepID=A0AAN8G3S2_TRICO
MLHFMENVINSVDRVRTGAIILSNKPVVDPALGEHSRQFLKDWMHANRQWLDAWTKVAYSLHLAREALLKEQTTHKIVLLLTDADGDAGPPNCQPKKKVTGLGAIFGDITLKEFSVFGMKMKVPVPLFAPQEEGPCDKFEQHMMSFQQETEAKNVRDAGIRIIYVAVGISHTTFLQRRDKIRNMAGDDRNVIFAGGFNRLDKDILQRTVETVCNKIV